MKANEPPAFSASSYSYYLGIGADGSDSPVSVETPGATNADADDTISYSVLASDASSTLYAVQDSASASNDALFSIDSRTGAGTRVGNANNFGQSDEIGPSALAWHDGELYMTGADSAKLYRVNPADGTAEAVGTASGFGVSETEPAGLASHGGELYMIGNATDRLYRLNTATGVATAVRNSTTNFGHRIQQARTGLASHAGKLYTLNAATNGLETLDATAGVAASVGASVNFGVGEGAAVALASDGAKLYMAGSETAKLYTLDTTTGTAASVGGLGSALSAPVALAGRYERPSGYTIAASTGTIAYTGASAPFDHHGLYARVSDSKAADGNADGEIDDRSLVSLRVVNSEPAFTKEMFAFELSAGSDGSVTPVAVGTASATDADTGDTLTYSLRAADASTRMYRVQDSSATSSDALFSVDGSTGTATRVNSSATDFGVNESSPIGLASHNGDLSLLGDSTDRLYALNTSTGLATRVGSAANFGVSKNSPRGIATGYSKPTGFEIHTDTGVITYSGGAITPGVYTLYAYVRDGKSSEGLTDGLSDDIVRVTITVPDARPEFDSESYSFTIEPGTDGSSTAVTVGTLTATDPAGHALTYSLRASDPSDRMYLLGSRADALYALDSDDSRAARIGNATRFRCRAEHSDRAHMAQRQALHARGHSVPQRLVSR